MSPSQRFMIVCLALCLAHAPAAMAQRQPHIGYVYPAGGAPSTTFQVTIGGQYLDGVRNVHVSGDGVEVAVVKHTKPLTQKQANELRQKLRELQKKKGDPEAAKEIAELRAKLAKFNRDANPAIAETVAVEVTVADGVEPGERELRLETPAALSNPLVFCVGQLSEVSEEEPKNSAAGAAMNVTLPAVVNGQILPGDVDRFRFQARRGQKLVAAAHARELIPYLADAVPGWFQATLTLYDAEGEEIAYADDYRYHPDPVLHYEVPEDGEYVIEIRDAIYRGREDFVYRLSLGELPFVTSIFPLGGPAGTRTTVEIEGWNLPAAKLKPDIREPGIHPLSVREGTRVSNRVPFAVDTLPERVEREPNNEPEDAQSVTLPLIVNGRIDPPGDWDAFCFEGRAGDEVVAEVHARRLNSPVDSVLKLIDPAGRQLAFNDDHEDKSAGLTTHHADSWLLATLPADGTYCLHMGDAQHKGGPAYAYRLRLSPPRPDFELRIVPSSISARTGMTLPVTVYAIRKDGFAGDIAMALKDAPDGFELSGWLPAGQDQAQLTLTVPPRPTEEPVSLRMEGHATIDGRQVTRSAVPADDLMQAFFYRHLVPAGDFTVVVTGPQRRMAPVRILDDTPIRIPSHGTARVRIAGRRGLFANEVQFDISEPPEGIAIRSAAPNRRGLELVLRSDAEMKPGAKGNLIVNAFTMRARTRPDGKPQGNKRRVSLGVLPAIPFEITEP